MGVAEGTGPTTPANHIDVSQSGLGVLTMFGMGWGSILPFALAALAPFVLDDLGWSRTRYGSLLTLNFVSGMLLSTWAGRFTDLTRRSASALILLFLSTAIALLIVSLGSSYAVMAGAATLGGLAISLTNPSTNKLIAAYGAVEARGLLIGIKQSGVQAGTFLSGVLLPPMAQQFGWRGALRVAAAVPLLSAAIAVMILPSRWPAGSQTTSADAPARVWWLMVYAFLMGGGIAAATYYLPLYAHERLGYPESSAGIFLSAIGITGVASRVVAGHFANRFTDASRLLTGMAVTAVGAQVLVWLAESRGSAFLWAGSLLIGASAVAWNAVAMLVVLRTSGFGAAGRASGAVSLAFYGGLIVTPTIFGMIVDETGSYSWGWLMAIVLFAGAAAVVHLRSHTDTSLVRR